MCIGQSLNCNCIRIRILFFLCKGFKDAKKIIKFFIIITLLSAGTLTSVFGFFACWSVPDSRGPKTYGSRTLLKRYVVWENFHDLQHQIEYPESNIPKRLNADEIIPADLKFHFHTDHIGTQYLTLFIFHPKKTWWFSAEQGRDFWNFLVYFPIAAVGGARPPPFIFTIMYKVAVCAPAERADRYTPSISSLFLCTLWSSTRVIFSCDFQTSQQPRFLFCQKE